MTKGSRAKIRRFVNLELTLWLLGFSICIAFQFWRGSSSDGWIFSSFALVLFCIGVVEPKPIISKPMNDREKIAFNRSRFLWILIAVLFCLWELYSYIAGYLAGNEDAYPTVSLLLYPFTAHMAGMAIFILIYLWLGSVLLRKKE